MKELEKNWELLEQICKDEKLDVAYLSIEFPDGSSYEYQANSM